MTQHEFTVEIKDRVTELAPDGYEIFIRDIAKPTGTYEGICAQEVGSSITAAINPIDLYVKYLDGDISLREASETVLNSLIKAPKPNTDNVTNIITDWETARDRLFIAPRKAESYNADKFLTHKQYDLTFIPYVYINKTDDGTISSTPVTNELVEVWNVSKETVLAYAIINNTTKFPAEICSLYEMLGFGRPTNGKEEMLYVKNDITGAGSAFTKQVYQAIYDRFGGDFYYLPSSIHEVIAVPAEDKTPKELADIVNTINETEVAPNEVLSYSIYRYYSSEGDLRVEEV